MTEGVFAGAQLGDSVEGSELLLVADILPSIAFGESQLGFGNRLAVLPSTLASEGSGSWQFANLLSSNFTSRSPEFMYLLRAFGSHGPYKNFNLPFGFLTVQFSSQPSSSESSLGIRSPWPILDIYIDKYFNNILN